MFYINFNTNLLTQIVFLPIFSLLFIIFVGFLYAKVQTRKLKIDEFTLNERIRNFKPRPLVESDESEFKEKTIKNSKLNFARVDFLSFSNNKNLFKVASDCIKEHGVGTCGPRPFYGTTEMLLTLEEKLAKFLSVEDATVYSYGYITVPTSIACYCKPGDILFVDDMRNIGIEQAISSIKSKVISFKHNDPQDFLAVLEKNQIKSKKCKKFLVLEGICAKDGSICRLPNFVDICKSYKIRLFIDETLSFGTLGKRGKGITEYHNVDSKDIDMIIGSLENTFYSIGGFCAGPHFVLEPQRMHSLGYVYSASLPTYSAKAAIFALDNMKNKPLLLRKVSLEVHKFLRSIDKLEVKSDAESPVKIFSVKGCRKPILANKLDEFFKRNDMYVLVEDGNIKMNLYADFGRNRRDYDEFCDIVRRGVKECLGLYDVNSRVEL